MDAVKHKIIYFWLTHCFLRHMGKRYPEWFKQWVYDAISSPVQRKILLMRYTGVTRMKFEAIALELKIDTSNLFKYHKKAVERLMDVE